MEMKETGSFTQIDVPIEEEEPLSQAQAAKFLKMAVNTFKTIRHEIPAVRKGQFDKYLPSDLRGYLLEKRRVPKES